MTVPVIHPRLLSKIGAFFPSTARIQAKTVVLDDYGQEQETWADVAMMPAAKAPLSAEERQAAGYTATDRAWTVLLQGTIPLVTTRHRVRVDNETFDVDAVETDQTTNVTRLRVRQVTT